MSYENLAKQYRTSGQEGVVESADPHRLIGIMLDTALDRIAAAKGHMQHGVTGGAKGEAISSAIGVIEGLRSSLDMRVGGALAGSLNDLYDYMARRLLLANLRNDPAILDEVSALLRELRAAWMSIDAEQRKPPAAPRADA